VLRHQLYWNKQQQLNKDNQLLTLNQNES